ncbi:uncharacterized protein LOC115883513 [Sitophilus oryzae]|nr:uncharacterized protein LOC115883513 [Sitophilus oryzae]
MPGAEKDWKSWRKAWQDLRSRTKSKQAKNQMYANGTGGGKKIDDSLTSVEEEVLAIIKKVSVEGHDVAESTVTNFIVNEQERIKNVTSNEQAQNHVFEEMKTHTTNAYTTSTDIESETDRELLSPLANISELQPQKQLPEKKENEKGKLPKKLDNLINSAVAATTFESNLKQKITLKQEYYAEKLAILRRMAEAEERKADSLQRIATAIEGKQGMLADLPRYLNLD